MNQQSITLNPIGVERTLSALPCDKVGGQQGSYSTDHLILAWEMLSATSRSRYTAFGHQMFEFDHQPLWTGTFLTAEGRSLQQRRNWHGQSSSTESSCSRLPLPQCKPPKPTTQGIRLSSLIGATNLTDPLFEASPRCLYCSNRQVNGL